MGGDMMAEREYKTPSYTRRANKNYRDKHDYMNITFDKGEPDLFRSVGLTAAVIRDMVRAEFERRNAQIKPTDNRKGKLIEDMDESEKDEFFNVNV